MSKKQILWLHLISVLVILVANNSIAANWPPTGLKREYDSIMEWSRHGADKVLQLRAAIASHQWPSVGNRFIKQHYQLAA